MILFKIFKWIVKGILLVGVIQFYQWMIYILYYIFVNNIPYKTTLFLACLTLLTHVILLLLVQKIIFNKEIINSIIRSVYITTITLLPMMLIAYLLVASNIQVMSFDYLKFAISVDSYFKPNQVISYPDNQEIINLARMYFNLVIIMFLTNVFMVIAILNKNSDGAIYDKLVGFLNKIIIKHQLKKQH
ncbi:hypothetical protein SAMN04489761_1152 [Tenacibaculum sp. MAR_2009_124]|uniref:hypothetical protein n=1 Tax=Tenacibaculum sp. MAR_2009_124 TaxID=1250059 RepID=UPI000894D6E3|nr:hypothetical protein [Tenacibaculum sp. MAR_2009_124]SEB51480.1 hypothetical protein SAMN04489761_1152 [Tenacibaculum sp. MAR_2009_124]